MVKLQWYFGGSTKYYSTLVDVPCYIGGYDLVCFVLLVSLYTTMNRHIFTLPHYGTTSAINLFAISLLQPFPLNLLQLLTSVCDDYPNPPPWINRALCNIISYILLQISRKDA